VVETPLEELGHGRDTTFQIVGEEKGAVENEGDGSDPFKAGNGQTDLEGTPRHANEMVRGNVGGDHGAADNPPGQVASGQEVIVGLLRLAGNDDTNQGDDEQVNAEDQEVESRGRHAEPLRQRKGWIEKAINIC